MIKNKFVKYVAMWGTYFAIALIISIITTVISSLFVDSTIIDYVILGVQALMFFIVAFFVARIFQESYLYTLLVLFVSNIISSILLLVPYFIITGGLF